MLNLWEHQLVRRLQTWIKEPVKVIFTENRVNLISVTSSKRVLRLRVHKMFAFADEEVHRDLAAFIQGKKRSKKSSLDDYIDQNSHLYQVQKRKKTKIRIRVKGQWFNLRSMFKKLNRGYFDGTVDCRITWGNMPTLKRRSSIRLGSYVEDDRLIRIHPLLDQEKVPELYLESVVYHEMIHAHLRQSGEDDQGVKHTDEFRAWEKKFSHNKFAKDWEKKNIQKLLSPQKQGS